jgi:hypothetical protein
MSPEELQAAEELSRTPSGHEIEIGIDGEYTLHPDTYDILTKRANLIIPLLEHIKKLDEDLDREIWCHAACLTIAEGGFGWDGELWIESPAIKAVKELRQLTNKQKEILDELIKRELKA